MNGVHHPEAYGLVVQAREMDALVEMARVFVRDYQASELHESILDGLEEVYVGERAGGRLIDLNAILGERGAIAPENDEGDEGGSPVPAEAG